jgi:hypothetical protein
VFWLAAVRDVFSRRIVGWKTSDRCDTDLILAAPNRSHCDVKTEGGRAAGRPASIAVAAHAHPESRTRPANSPACDYPLRSARAVPTSPKSTGT